jgi:hypothetical protein
MRPVSIVIDLVELWGIPSQQTCLRAASDDRSSALRRQPTATQDALGLTRALGRYPTELYGPKKTLYNRFVRWAVKGVWTGVFETLASAGGRRSGRGRYG